MVLIYVTLIYLTVCIALAIFVCRYVTRTMDKAIISASEASDFVGDVQTWLRSNG